MGKGVLISGLVLGILGVLWSFVSFAIAALFVAFGGTGAFLLIPALGFLLGILAIVGSVVGNTRTQAGAVVILVGGALMVLAAISIALSEAGITGMDALAFSLVVAWWAYGLVIAGILALLLHRSGVTTAAP